MWYALFWERSCGRGYKDLGRVLFYFLVFKTLLSSEENLQLWSLHQTAKSVQCCTRVFRPPLFPHIWICKKRKQITVQFSAISSIMDVCMFTMPTYFRWRDNVFDNSILSGQYGRKTFCIILVWFVKCKAMSRWAGIQTLDSWDMYTQTGDRRFVNLKSWVVLSIASVCSKIFYKYLPVLNMSTISVLWFMWIVVAFLHELSLLMGIVMNTWQMLLNQLDWEKSKHGITDALWAF